MQCTVNYFDYVFWDKLMKDQDSTIHFDASYTSAQHSYGHSKHSLVGTKHFIRFEEPLHARNIAATVATQP